MSHHVHHNTSPNSSDDDDNLPQILKPKPLRTFELTSPPPSAPSTPPPDPISYLSKPSAMDGGTSTPNRNRSFLNLTTSTLFGIYQPTGYTAEKDEANPSVWGAATPWGGSTPWGTGAQTPSERSPVSRTSSLDWPSRMNIPDTTVLQNGSYGTNSRRKGAAAASSQRRMRRKGFKGVVVPVMARGTTLFVMGVAYALLITHLHDHRGMAPVRVELDRSSWSYLILWGLAGVVLGEALPWADRFWLEDPDRDQEDITARHQQHQRKRRESGLDGWMDVVRSTGAFIGIAFAIRKLPWQSSLQLSLTLALANPALWYLIDRSPPGFILSTFVALAGTLVLLGINPALVPSPSPAQVLRQLVARNGKSALPDADSLVLGVFSPESVGVATWIASVFFVSAVCFGNIGRRLARS